MKNKSLLLIIGCWLFVTFYSASCILHPAFFVNAQGISLEQEYDARLRTYQTAKRDFDLAKAAYQQAETISSLEEAVIASRDFFIARDEVLLTYTRLLSQNLQSSYGVYLETKQEKLDDLDLIIRALEKHLEESKNIQDKNDLITATSNFQLVSESLIISSKEVNPLLSIGKIQTVYDKSKILVDSIETKAQTVEDKNERSKLQRAINLIKEKQDNLNTLLQELNGPIIRDNQGNQQNDYKQTQEAYALASQILEYMSELTGQL